MKQRTFDYSSLKPIEHPCPLCGGCDFTLLARQDRNLIGLATVGCRQCGLIQTNPRPSAAGLDVFYRDHYRMLYQGASGPSQRYIVRLNKDARLAYTSRFFIEHMKVPLTATLLDFGCGEGSLFAALRAAGFNGAFYGVEPNSSFAEFASELGNALVSNSIRAREPVDLIVVNHVLEHLADPLGTLRELGSLLTDEGQLYVDVPDAEAYSGINDLHIAHLFHFTARTVRSLVEHAGFTVTTVERHRPPFHPPSVRLVARFVAPTRALACDPAQESRAWTAVRRAGHPRNTLTLRLRRLPGLHAAYRFARRWIRPPVA